MPTLILIPVTWLAPRFNLAAALASLFSCNLAESLITLYVFPSSRRRAR